MGRPRLNKNKDLPIRRQGRPRKVEDLEPFTNIDFELVEQEWLITSEWDAMPDCMKTDRLISAIRTMVRPELAVALGMVRGGGLGRG